MDEEYVSVKRERYGILLRDKRRGKEYVSSSVDVNKKYLEENRRKIKVIEGKFKDLDHKIKEIMPSR